MASVVDGSDIASDCSLYRVHSKGRSKLQNKSVSK